MSAIRAADPDNNPETLIDPTWPPEVGNTTPDPSYPGPHAVISERSFERFSAAKEATLSQIFAGVHFRFELTIGKRLG